MGKKSTAKQIASLLSFLINESFESGVFIDLKITKIKPIQKKRGE